MYPEPSPQPSFAVRLTLHSFIRRRRIGACQRTACGSWDRTQASRHCSQHFRASSHLAGPQILKTGAGEQPIRVDAACYQQKDRIWDKGSQVLKSLVCRERPGAGRCQQRICLQRDWRGQWGRGPEAKPEEMPLKVGEIGHLPAAKAQQASLTGNSSGAEDITQGHIYGLGFGFNPQS